MRGRFREVAQAAERRAAERRAADNFITLARRYLKMG